MLSVIDDLHKTWPGTYTELKQVFSGIESGEIKLLSEEEIEKKMEEFKESLQAEEEDHVGARRHRGARARRGRASHRGECLQGHRL